MPMQNPRHDLSTPATSSKWFWIICSQTAWTIARGCSPLCELKANVIYKALVVMLELEPDDEHRILVLSSTSGITSLLPCTNATAPARTRAEAVTTSHPTCMHTANRPQSSPSDNYTPSSTSHLPIHSNPFPARPMLRLRPRRPRPRMPHIALSLQPPTVLARPDLAHRPVVRPLWPRALAPRAPARHLRLQRLGP